MTNHKLIKKNQQSLPGNAPLSCKLCPRLFDFRMANKNKFPDFFNGPVPAFGSKDAELLIVGLAPGLKGANRTGRPFTGDYAGDLLYPTLAKFGFAQGTYDGRIDDGLVLHKAIITNAVSICWHRYNNIQAILLAIALRHYDAIDFGSCISDVCWFDKAV